MKDKIKMKTVLIIALFANLITIENFDTINTVLAVMILVVSMCVSLVSTINLYGEDGK